MREYLRNLTIALDRFLNVLLFNGRPDETISYHAAKAEVFGKKWGCYFCKFLHWIDHKHCHKTLNNEETKAAAGLRLLGVLLLLFATVFYILPIIIL